MFNKIKERLSKAKNLSHSYILEPSKAYWSQRNYTKFADEAYIKNVIAHRAIGTISSSAASVPFSLHNKDDGSIIKRHQILDLLRQPNPAQNLQEFMESIYSYKQISGNAYILAICSGKRDTPIELYALRPDRVTISQKDSGIPESYIYKIGKQTISIPVDAITGRSHLLHIKSFNPLSDFYGLSSIEAAAYSIDQHNQAGEWNQALLQNGARPSGAIVVGGNGGAPNLTESQYNKLRAMIKETFSGAKNAGNPIVLEGGLDWKEMSLSPKDMDFIESKHSSAREIALALGMPPQLLGIPGDNTYSNLQEARLALWEQTIIPLVQSVVSNMSNWLCGYFSSSIQLSFDVDKISALGPRREEIWRRAEESSFLTINEKRALVGLGPIKNGDTI